MSEGITNGDRAAGDVRPQVAAGAHVATFVRQAAAGDMPADVIAMARRCMLDLAGVAAAGVREPPAAIVRAHAADEMAGARRSARMLFDGRRVALAGAALAGATMIDAVDAHDGHPLTKGHAGVAVLPALLAFVDGTADKPPIDGAELLANVVVGYEIATRAGIALHATAPDFHCSGAWNAIAAAALGVRRLGLGHDTALHALGIAEYYGPRGQILRVCDHPTMLKDGSGWGAHAGVTAALLAERGFTGAPAATVDRPEAAAVWSDLGRRWRIREQYFKAYPVCRWAQPAIEAVRELVREHAFEAEQVARIDIESFAEAVALGSQCARPSTGDEAQYSITWPVAAVLALGDVGPDALGRIADPRITRLLDQVHLTEDPALSQRFPAARYARVSITLGDGRRLASGECVARGSAENPLSDDEIRAKFDAYAGPVLGRARADRLARAIDALDVGRPVDGLLDDLLAPVG